METAPSAGESGGAHIVAELVIFGALLGVGEHIIGLGGLLEFLLGLLVARVLVGMILYGLLSIGAFYGFLVGIPVDSKHFVIVSFRCHDIL